MVRKHQSLDESFLTYATMFAYFLPGVVVGATLGITVGYFDQEQLIKNWTRFDSKSDNFSVSIQKPNARYLLLYKIEL